MTFPAIKFWRFNRREGHLVVAHHQFPSLPDSGIVRQESLKKRSDFVEIREELSKVLMDLIVYGAGFGFSVSTLIDLSSYSIWGLLGLVKRMANTKK